MAQGGFTLLELSIYMAVMAIAGIPLIAVSLTASRSSATGIALSKIQERNRILLQRIDTEFETSLAGTATVGVGGKSLRFTTNGGFDGTGAASGPVIRFEIRLAAAELANGKDDNGNGLIDEAVLVRVDESTGIEVVLTNDMSYPDSSFALSGDKVTVTFANFFYSVAEAAVNTVKSTVTALPLN
jgi:type II secretory pathway pseudopilin PulG